MNTSGDMEEAARTPTNRARARSPLVGSASSSITRHPKAQRVDLFTPLQDCPLFPTIIAEGDKGNKRKGRDKGPDPWNEGKGKCPWSGGKDFMPSPPAPAHSSKDNSTTDDPPHDPPPANPILDAITALTLKIEMMNVSGKKKKKKRMRLVPK